MFIDKKISQHRRDFRAVYQCEHCGNKDEGRGYDDAYFHQQVIPDMTCSECGLSSHDLSPTSPAPPRSTPDVPAHVVI